jgi:hypothetical protein
MKELRSCSSEDALRKCCQDMNFRSLSSKILVVSA